MGELSPSLSPQNDQIVVLPLVNLAMTEMAEMMDPSRRKCPPKKPLPFHLSCAVCDKKCNYTYYGVHCCEGCKQFFRRAIIKRNLWLCNYDSNCNIAEDFRDQCKSCRLDKCLRVGMNWEMINVEPGTESNHYFDELEQRKRQLLGDAFVVNFAFVDRRCSDPKLLQYLLRVAKCRERIWNAYLELPDDYCVAKHEHFVDFVRSSDNLLGRATRFSIFWECPPCLLDTKMRTQLLEEFGQMGVKHPRFLKMCLIDRLLAYGTAKAMPVFPKLALDDQVILLRHTAMPLIAICNSYTSAKADWGSWTASDGFQPSSIGQLAIYREDANLKSLLGRACFQSVGSFRRVAVETPEEFVLLVAILLSHSAIPELSASARDLLYAESVRYSRMLLRILQSRLGAAAGAGRYADYLTLVEGAFHCARVHDLLSTYMDLCYFRRQMTELDQQRTFPKFLIDHL